MNSGIHCYIPIFITIYLGIFWYLNIYWVSISHSTQFTLLLVLVKVKVYLSRYIKDSLGYYGVSWVYLRVFERRFMVMGGLEPPTAALWVLCSNQLSYMTLNIKSKIDHIAFGDNIIFTLLSPYTISFWGLLTSTLDIVIVRNCLSPDKPFLDISMYDTLTFMSIEILFCCPSSWFFFTRCKKGF